MVVCGVYREQAHYALALKLYRQLKLTVGLVQNQVVFLVNHAVAVSAVLREDLEAPSQRPGVVGPEEPSLRPAHVSVVRAHLGYLFFVALDSPEGADVVTIHPVLGLFLAQEDDHASCCCGL